MPVTPYGVAMLVLAVIAAVVLGVWFSGYGNCC